MNFPLVNMDIYNLYIDREREENAMAGLTTWHRSLASELLPR